MSTTEVLIVAIIAVVALALLVFIVISVVSGAVVMFQWANTEAGFLGTMIMLAFWIAALPVMIVLAAIIGICVIYCAFADDDKPAFPKYRRYSVRREGDSAIRIMKL